MFLTAAIVIAAFVLILIYASIRILREYERGVVFTLGRYTGTKGPGLFLLVPFIQQMVRVDLRLVVDEVPPQDVISRDNVSVKVSAVIYFRVVDAERGLLQHQLRTFRVVQQESGRLHVEQLADRPDQGSQRLFVVRG